MRDKDTIILESLYGLVVEKAKDVVEKLKTLNVPEEIINQFIAIDPTGQKNDAQALGVIFANQNPDVNYLISLYKQFLKFKNKNNSQTKDFPRQFDSLEKLEVTIRDLNSVEVLKFVPDRQEANRLLTLDPAAPKIEASIVAKWINDGKRTLLPKDVVDAYEQFVELKEQGIEGSEDVSKYKSYVELTEFLHQHIESEDKVDVGAKVNITKKPVYNDDEVAIWYVANTNEAISIGNALIDMNDVRTPDGKRPANWCTTWSIVGGGTNMFMSYRTYQKWTFYYTWSKKRNTGFKETKGSEAVANDPYVITAIGVTRDGQYALTPAPNGTRTAEPWSTIESWMPELKGKQGYFKYKPLSNEEEDKMVKLERLARYFEEEQFLNLSQMDQYEYISAGYNIPAKTFVKLSKERKNDYLNIMAEDLDREMPEDLEAVLEEREMKRYLALHERAWENHLQGIEAAL
jgi:hypothetical protein